MSRREDFARLVDGDAGASGGAVAGLADVATALRVLSRSVTLPAPDPQFRSDLRQRLVAVATVQGVQPTAAGAGLPSRVAGRRTPRASDRTVARGRRAVMALAGSVVLVTSVAGVSVAASRSLPGSPFYDLKRAAESAQLLAARGQLDQGHRHLQFAATRLGEARALSPTSSHLSSTLDAMDAETRDGTNDLIAAARHSHSVTPLNQLRAFTHSQYAGLQALIAASPPALRPRETRSVNLLAGIDRQAAQLTATSGLPGSAVTGPGGGGLSGLLKGALPLPGSQGGGSAPGQPGPGSITAPHGHSGPAAPAPSSSIGVPAPAPSLPVKVPTTLPSILPTLPTTLPTVLPPLPRALPSVLPSLPITLPTGLPSVLPSIKL